MYLDVKRGVIEAGFAWEVEWQGTVTLNGLTEPGFLREAAWVILCSGMREAVVRGRFADLSEAFLGWRSAQEIVVERRSCRRRALAAFNHRSKIDAIIDISRQVAAVTFEGIRADLVLRGVSYLQSLPFIGPVTSFHLAKNIGLQVAKPDRHLVRIAAMFGFSSAQGMCAAIADVVQDPIPVVDVVLWRFAALHREYPRLLMQSYTDLWASGT